MKLFKTIESEMVRQNRQKLSNTVQKIMCESRIILKIMCEPFPCINLAIVAILLSAYLATHILDAEEIHGSQYNNVKSWMKVYSTSITDLRQQVSTAMSDGKITRGEYTELRALVSDYIDYEKEQENIQTKKELMDAVK